MDEKKYLDKLTKCIHDPEVRGEVREEYAAHLADCMEALQKKGMSLEEAWAEAVRQMGDPVKAGCQMDHIYRTNVDWKMAVWMAACGLLIGFFVLFMRTAYYGEELKNETGLLIWTTVGVVFVVWGFIWSAVEKYHDMDLFYAWAKNWNGGGVTNSGLIIGIGLAFLASDVKDILLMVIVFGLLQMAERYLIARCQCRKEERLLWEIGEASTPIYTHKGKAMIGQKEMKVCAKKGEIAQGRPVMVIGLKGFCPVVVPV